MRYISILALFVLAGCAATKPVVTPIKVGITKISTVNESVYQTNEENKTSVSKITIYTTTGQLKQEDILALLERLKTLPTTK
jgi:outer membrane biogenesis lipoprotein LolB